MVITVLTGFALYLVIVNFTECKRDTYEDFDSSMESPETEEYGKLLDLRGKLRQKFALIASLQYPGISCVCSPISALLPLGKMALGAHGRGRRELNNVIGIQSEEDYNDDEYDYVEDETDVLKRHLAVFMKDLEDLPGVVLNVASRLYVSQNKNLYSNYTDAAKRIFKTAVEKIDFKRPSAAAENINNWVSERTRGMIKDLVSPDLISTASSLIAVNAIYFCGQWDEPFPTVVPGPFYSPNGVKNIPMMKIEHWYNYKDSKTLSAQLVEIPYVGMKSSFLIVLPKSKSGLKKVLEKLKRKPKLLSKAMKKMESAKLKLTIPKFRTESLWNLKSLYQDIGLRAIFKKKNSGLTSIVRGETLEVTGAVQKAIIEVNELGTKGAAGSEEPTMIPNEIFAEDLMSTVIRYGLYIGAAFQLVCLVACVTLTDEQSDSHPYEKAYTDSDECSSEQSSPGHRATISRARARHDKKKRR